MFGFQISAIITEFKKFLLNFGSGELITLVDFLGVSINRYTNSGSYWNLL